MSERLEPLPQDAYGWHYATAPQWADSDLYGHVNNVAYLRYFDTAMNMALLNYDALDLSASGAGPIGLVVRNGAQFFREITFPASLSVGVRIEAVGRTSLTWGFGLFDLAAGACAARGQFVHVYVDRATRRPVPLTPALRACADALFRDPATDPATDKEEAPK
ncbi:acyl-CoA thioesterase [Salipiger bermudensis]|uniref:acyl-CoA thioesterase n=1 Tax=Salipiger bermudensis TaxID=344736 RepID=UPI001CD66017|nr:thioesterase family protein [Salipiger bermudensis]MCA0963046.1 acyl-CoA thioesterase [Salipiger bermudensis]